ncbi:MAG: endo-1,4-beta-xylanase [Puniceicoccales bacterium]
MNPTPAFQFPDLQQAIDDGINRHRKGQASILLTDAKGHALPGVDIEIEQVESEFLFGANLFMLNGYDSSEKNNRYEEAYTRLFNAATVPLYWKELEPQPGKLRFSTESCKIARRPPPDLVVDFCESYNLNMNGHTLSWNNCTHSIPNWLHSTADSAILKRRIDEITERYGEKIQRWDVVNEPSLRHIYPEIHYHPMEEDYERLSLEWAAASLPDSAHLMINEAPGGVWIPENRKHLHRLIRSLQAQNTPLNGIGMQFHLFDQQGMQNFLSGEKLPPQTLLAAMDSFQEFGLPLHISEITLHSLRNDRAGQAAQAASACDLYRLCFSHPSVHAITWWNVPDGGAVFGEDELFSGLLDKDLNPKPAYEALHDLIHNQWRTKVRTTTHPDGTCLMEGFYGDYTLKAGNKRYPFRLSSIDPNELIHLCID